MSLLEPVKLPQLFFTDNPGEVVFRIKEVLADTSGYPSLVLIFDSGDPPVDTDVLALDINGVESALTFTFDDLTDDPLKLPFYVSGSFADYAQLLAEHLYRHPDISRNYYVRHTFYLAPFAGIEIISRRRGKVYNIEVNSGDTTVNLDSSTVATTYADDDVVTESLKLKARVTTIIDMEYNQTETDTDDVEATGVVNADADEMLVTLHELPAIGKTVLGIDIPYNTAIPLPVRSALGALKIEANTESAEGLVKSFIQEFTSATVSLLLTGGVELKNFNPLDFITWLTGTGERFFSPGTKLVTKEQPEWVHVLFFESLQPLDYDLVVLYSDNSTQTKSIAPVPLVGGAWMLPTGFDQNALAELNPGGVTEVSWKVVNPADGSTVFTYVIDTRYFNTDRYFIYQNALGFIETLRVVGVADFSIKHRRETSTTVLTSHSRSDRGTIEMILNEREDYWTMRTGWLLTKEDKDLLIQMLGSRYLAEVVMPLLAPVTNEEEVVTYYRQPYRSCIVLQDVTEMYDDKTGLYALEWKMKYAHNELNSITLPALPEVWYDSVIELDVVVTQAELDDNSGVLELSFGTNAEANVKIEDSTGAIALGVNYEITTPGLHHFKISGSDLTLFTIQSLDGAGVLTVKHIETRSLADFTVVGFETLQDDYLCKRIQTLWCLQNLVIWLNDDPGFSMNKMLTSLIHLYKAGIGNLADVDFSFATPDTLGAYMKNYLIAEGVTVTTI